MPKGGKRPGSGRKRKIIDPAAAPLTRSDAAEIIEALEQPAKPGESKKIADWRLLWEAQDLRIRLDTRKYLYDKRDGKPVQTVNHLHDKPIEMNVTLSLAETIQKARKRALAK